MDKEIKISVDAIVFGYSKEEGVRILLIRRKYPPFKDSWAIPGGFVLNKETLEEAVYRELKEETGISINYLEQLYTFGDPNRDPRNRVISVAYFGLINSNKYRRLIADTDASEASWFPINELPNLAFDHRKIVQKALIRLKNKIRYEPIGFELLDEKFPFSDLEELYASLSGEQIDRRNFKKKVMSYGIIEELEEYAEKGGPGRPGKLYKFNKKVYSNLQKKGVYFEV